MATQTIVIGEQTKKGNPIIFSRKVMINNIGYITSVRAGLQPQDFAVVELIKKGKNDDLDVMFAYTDDRNSGEFYLGTWNDGIVE